MASIANENPPVNLLPRTVHLAAQLERNRAYYASLWNWVWNTAAGDCAPPFPTVKELADEMACVAAVIRLIEADLSLLPVAPPLSYEDMTGFSVADLEAQAADVADSEASR